MFHKKDGGTHRILFNTEKKLKIINRIKLIPNQWIKLENEIQKSVDENINIDG